MKISIKSLVLIFSCVSISLHSSEKKLNPDKVIREAWMNGGVIDTTTASILLQQAEERMKEQNEKFITAEIHNYINADQLVPERIIRVADTDSAQLASKHNEDLAKHYHNLSQLPQG